MRLVREGGEVSILNDYYFFFAEKDQWRSQNMDVRVLVL